MFLLELCIVFVKNKKEHCGLKLVSNTKKEINIRVHNIRVKDIICIKIRSQKLYIYIFVTPHFSGTKHTYYHLDYIKI